MANWAVFASIFGQIAPYLTTGIDATNAALVAWVAPLLKVGIIIYLVLRMLTRAIRHDGEPMAEMEINLIKGALALYIATNLVAYDQYVRDVMLTRLSGEVSQQISGAAGATISAASFDAALNKAFVAGLSVFRNLSFWDPGRAIALGILVIVFWIVSALCIAAGFVIWLQAYLFLTVLIEIGPIFVGLFFFPMLVGIFARWFGAMLANVIQQVLAVALLTMLLSAEAGMLGSIIDQAPPSGGNEFAQLQLLVGGIILFVITALIAVGLPGLSSSIASGFTVEATRGGRWAVGAGGKAASLGRDLAGKLLTAANPTKTEIGKAYAAARTPPGKSLSD